MAKDSLARGLLAAARAIKPAGNIYVVLDTWKFGRDFHYAKTEEKKKLLKTWNQTFLEQTGFSFKSSVLNLTGAPDLST